MSRAIISWSGGKDSALALYHACRSFDVVGLLTTVTAEVERISMHGVRRSLLEQQAEALGIPLCPVVISKNSSNDEYESKMTAALDAFHRDGIEQVICGDLFLEEIRRYREERLFRDKMQGVFPLWQRNTGELAREFIALGFKAVLCCVDTTQLPGEFAGRLFDDALLRDLPAAVDPCGENGEFHSFVFEGPIFKHPIAWTPGEKVLRDERFMFAELMTPS